MHLTIKKKHVFASSVTRSGAGMQESHAWDEDPPQAEKPAEQAPARPQDAPPETTPVPAPAQEKEETQPHQLSAAEGFGAFLQSQIAPPAPKTEEKPESTEERPSALAAMRRPQSNSPPPTAAPPPQTASSLQKMKEQGMYRNQYFKDAECFDCGHKFKTGRSAKSASCPTCGAYISLEDVEVNMPSTQPVKTRGDVLIRKRGRLSTSSVQCRDLNCQGIIEANVSCSGDATFRTTGSIIGEIRCHRFVVEKGADVAFMNPVHAAEVEIQARVTGTIYCTGPVLINSNGSVNGDVTARSVSIEPGGELNGAMNIVRGRSLPGAGA
ncbi:MAG: polymer-forming cytoskeletal protein [Prosthecobacter sp.]